ncbi:PrsW family glutamic-type intramembrane protease [Candidatus Riflebacteria bacterium]
MKRKNFILLLTAIFPFFICLIIYLSLGPIEIQVEPDVIDLVRIYNGEKTLFSKSRVKKLKFNSWKIYLEIRANLKKSLLIFYKSISHQDFFLHDEVFFKELNHLIPSKKIQLLKFWYNFCLKPEISALEKFQKAFSQDFKEFYIIKADILDRLASSSDSGKLFNLELKSIEKAIRLFPDEKIFKQKECNLLLRFNKIHALFELSQKEDYQKIFDDKLLFKVYKEAHQFGKMLLPLFKSQYREMDMPAIVGALVTGMSWMIFILFLVPRNFHFINILPWFIFSFFLGVISAHFTLAFAIIEDELIPWANSGQSWINFIYFVFGVGLREETLKILLFLPIFFSLKEKDPTLCLLLASTVGLGFATEENTLYFKSNEKFLGRFLTANFFHLSLTGILGHKLGIFFKEKKSWRAGEELTHTFLSLILIHGLYDFFIVDPGFADWSWLTLTIFIYLSQIYLRLVFSFPIRNFEALKIAFVFCVALVIAVGFLVGSIKFGLQLGLIQIFHGILNNFFILYMFFYEFPT